jgi:hypothetical protein
MGVGLAGAAVLAAVVVMLPMADAKFVAVKVNGPPNAPVVIFCSDNVGGFGAFVKVQTILAKGFRLTVGTVITEPARLPKLAGLPEVAALVSVHVPLDRLKLLFAASVNVTAVLISVTEI